MRNSLFSLCLHRCVLSSSSKWNLLGEEVGKGTSNREDQGMSEAGTYFMALDISEKYQSQIQWPLEHVVISVAFRGSKHGELCSVA